MKLKPVSYTMMGSCRGKRDAARIFLMREIKRNENIDSIPPLPNRSLIELHYLIISHSYQYQRASGLPRDPELS